MKGSTIRHRTLAYSSVFHRIEIGSSWLVSMWALYVEISRPAKRCDLPSGEQSGGRYCRSGASMATRQLRGIVLELISPFETGPHWLQPIVASAVVTVGKIRDYHSELSAVLLIPPGRCGLAYQEKANQLQIRPSDPKDERHLKREPRSSPKRIHISGRARPYNWTYLMHGIV